MITRCGLVKRTQQNYRRGVFCLMFIITNEKEVQPVGCVLPNTLVHGDCLEVMKYIPDGSIDLVLCDPPYG